MGHSPAQWVASQHICAGVVDDVVRLEAVGGLLQAFLQLLEVRRAPDSTPTLPQSINLASRVWAARLRASGPCKGTAAAWTLSALV